MRCIIVDDEPHARGLLRNLLDQGNHSLQVLGEASDVQSAIELITYEKPDIVFLDIRIKERLGFEVLDHFTQPDFKIVFTTAYDEYALQAFKYAAVHYLLKPYDIKSLDVAIERCIASTDKTINKSELEKHLESNQGEAIVVPGRSGTARYPVKEILYLVGAGAYTEIYLSEGRTVLASKPLGHFEKMYSSSNLMRVHKKHMVNLSQVRHFERGSSAYITLSDGRKLEVSRTYKSKLTKVLDA